jgi:hypothetical protein
MRDSLLINAVPSVDIYFMVNGNARMLVRGIILDGGADCNASIACVSFRCSIRRGSLAMVVDCFVCLLA